MSEAEPEAAPGSPDGVQIGPLRRAWSHRTTKMAALCVVAVVVVVAIIWGIRMAHKNPGADTPPSTTATTGAGSASSQPPHTAFVLPITTAQLTQYEQYAQGLQKGNAAATKVFVSSGNTPTAAQLTAPVAAYRTAVNLYDFDLRFIQWPPSMAAAIAADHTQLEVLVNFLQTYATAGTANVDGLAVRVAHPGRGGADHRQPGAPGPRAAGSLLLPLIGEHSEFRRAFTLTSHKFRTTHTRLRQDSIRWDCWHLRQRGRRTRPVLALSGLACSAHSPSPSDRSQRARSRAQGRRTLLR